MTHQFIQEGRMPATAAISLLGGLIPSFHAHGQDHVVEALSEAIDALDWLPLHTAPRDGSWIMLAIAPKPQFDLDGFVCFGRWIMPPAGEALGRDKRDLLDRYGGWWSSSKHERPFKRPVLAWRPIPAVDFDHLLRRLNDPAPELADDVAFANIPIDVLRAAIEGGRADG